MNGQAEPSEMIDVVDVSYRIVEVRQQKYVCAPGRRAQGPRRLEVASRYSGRGHALHGARDRQASRRRPRRGDHHSGLQPPLAGGANRASLHF